jgi:menaquinone-9 beta-reductase
MPDVLFGLDGLGSETWDAVVIGAGPAGAMVAARLSERGRSVLLVEKSVFPRWKVCGACVGGAGVAVLERAGLMGAMEDAGARRVTRADLLWRGRKATIAIGGMVTISRDAFDMLLVDHARSMGARACFNVRGEAGEDGRVRLIAGESECEIEARIVVQAGGLRAAQGDAARVRRGAWIGLGATSLCDDFGDGSLTMMVGDRGYVGRIVTENGRANWAAAVDPTLVREAGSPGEAVARICAGQRGEWSPPKGGWVGTPALTRRCPVVSGRVFRVGDAAGYVEPITGEGMSWALLGAEALAEEIEACLSAGGRQTDWARCHARLMRSRRLRCGLVARALRSPTAMGMAIGLMEVGRGSVWSGRVVGRLIGGHR